MRLFSIRAEMWGTIFFTLVSLRINFRNSRSAHRPVYRHRAILSVWFVDDWLGLSRRVNDVTSGDMRPCKRPRIRWRFRSVLRLVTQSARAHWRARDLPSSCLPVTTLAADWRWMTAADTTDCLVFRSESTWSCHRRHAGPIVVQLVVVRNFSFFASYTFLCYSSKIRYSQLNNSRHISHLPSCFDCRAVLCECVVLMRLVICAVQKVEKAVSDEWYEMIQVSGCELVGSR